MDYPYDTGNSVRLLQELKRRPALRVVCTVLAALLALAAYALMLYSKLGLPAAIAGDVYQTAQTLMVIFLAAFAGLIWAGWLIRTDQVGEESEVGTIRRERAAIQERMAGRERQTVRDTIQLGLNQLEEYYALSKSQARSSFRWGIGLMLLGFASIIGGIWVFYFRGAQNVPLTALSTCAGIVTDVFGGILITVYINSLRLLTVFHAELARSRDTMLAVSLAEDLGDSARQDAARDRIIDALMQRASLVVDSAFAAATQAHVAQSGGASGLIPMPVGEYSRHD